MKWYGRRGTVARGAVMAWGLATAVATAETPPAGAVPPKSFDGPYLGIDVGRQNLIGGSLVDGVDTLQQDSRTVVSFPIGWRKQLGGFVFGIELAYGLADGDLRLVDEARELQVDYSNQSQLQIGGLIGHTLGARRTGLIFGYLAEASRSFDVTIRRGEQVVHQGDDQGLLRYGLGGELSVGNGLRVRATFGSSRAKFDRPTNIEPASVMDASLGLVFQF